jgi:hypothetical protein
MDLTSGFVPGGAPNHLGRYCTAVLRNNSAFFGEIWTAVAVWCIPGAKLVEAQEAIVPTSAASVAAMRCVFKSPQPCC